MNYPTLPIGFLTGHPLEGLGIVLASFYGRNQRMLPAFTSSTVTTWAGFGLAHLEGSALLVLILDI